MKYCYKLLLLTLLALSSRPAAAQATRDAIEAQRLYRQTNAALAASALRLSLSQQADGFLGAGSFQAGTLRTFDGQRRPVPGLRYHTGQRVVEAQDSLYADSTHYWPVGSLRGFDVGKEGAVPRRFRPHLVREGPISGPHREYIEVLTTLDNGPLVLGWLYTQAPVDPTTSRRALIQILVAGPGGAASSESLRPLELTQSAVLRLFGSRNAEVRRFAVTGSLRYDRPTDVARMVDYFNQVAVVK